MHRLAGLWAHAWKPVLASALVFLMFACGGGGCSGCAGCGIQPIPGAFPLANRIPNSAQVRLTQSGIQFVQDNIMGIVTTVLPGGLDFPIPPTDTTASIPVVGSVRIRICTAGNCRAHATITNLRLVPTAPNVLHTEIHLQVDTRDDAGARASLPLRLGPSLCVLGACVVDTTCQVDIDTTAGSRPDIGLQTDITFATDHHPARDGYTQIQIGTISLMPGNDIEDADITFGSCSGISGAIINFVAGLLKGTLVSQLQGQISGLLNSAVGDQLCTQAGMYGCPTGTFADGTGATAICRYGTAHTDTCVPILLGTDGRGDLGGSFLGGFSPGTHAPLQFVLASGGDGQAMNNGMTLEMIGGFMSMDPTFTTSPGHNPCVPRIDPPTPFPPVIPQASIFEANTIPGTTTPAHLGIGISESYLNYAGYGMFDSGMLCIGTGTRISQQLSTGLLSALVRSLNSLTFPSGNSSVAIAVRPQQPPRFDVGTSASAPTLTVTLPHAMIDFYVWSTERYIRFMTYESDIVVEINLSVNAMGQIVPEIAGVTPMNSMVTNSELLQESPMALASTLETVIHSFAGMLGSGISPIDLPSVMGFNLTIPDGGLGGATSDGEDFLSIWANLSLAHPLVEPMDTTLELSDLVIDERGMQVATWGETRNTVWLHFDGQGPDTGGIEYSYRVDGGPWSQWTRDRRIQIDDDVLLLQARHDIEARARAVGSPTSADPTPAHQTLIIDTLAPDVSLERDENGLVAVAHDIVSDADLTYRFRQSGGEWSDWTTNEHLPLTAEALAAAQLVVEVQARDEAGNIGTAQQALIRGIPNPSATGGCGCRVTSTDRGQEGLGLLGTLVTLGLLVSRRGRRGSRRRDGAMQASTFRRALIALFGLALAGALTMGCSCSSPTVRGDGGPEAGGGNCGDQCVAAAPPGSPAGQVCCTSQNMCVDYNVLMLCPAGQTCPVDSVMVDDACHVTCGMCVDLPPLQPGYLATDLDMVISASGDRIVSGYSPGVPTMMPYGDLVVGVAGSSETSTFNWEIVDGAPAMPVVAQASGWRHGVSAPGDDVGRWTSIADSGTNIYISYYDQTHHALRLAIGNPGAGGGVWHTQTVDAMGDAGRYSNLILLPGNIPAIAYLGFQVNAMGQVQSGVRVAVASSSMPAAASDWTITRIHDAQSPCRPALCPMGQACLASGTCVMPAASGCSMCGTNTVCVAGMCQPSLPNNYVEDLIPAHGLYPRLARSSSGLALIYYDRTEGNLYGVQQSGSMWGTPFLIDGYGRGMPYVGDSGIGASLFIDAMGTWHVTYVDGAEEALRYVQVAGGAVTVRETVDDGSTSDGTMAYTDGRHIVGDDSSVVVMPSGEVRVAYQDATAEHTMIARRDSMGRWTHAVLDPMPATGFWVEQEISGTNSYVASWWLHRMGATVTNGVRVTQVP